MPTKTLCAIVAVICSAFSLFAGCDSSSSSEEECLSVSQARVVIQAVDKRYESFSPASLDVTNGETPTYRFAVFGDNEREGWSVGGYLTEGQVLTGSFSVPVSDDARNTSAASLSVRSESELVDWATDGLVTGTIANGRITGTVEATPARLSATFEGDLAIACWIPRRQYDPTSDESGEIRGSADPEFFELDDNFDSPFCQPFRALKR